MLYNGKKYGYLLCREYLKILYKLSVAERGGTKSRIMDYSMAAFCKVETDYTTRGRSYEYSLGRAYACGTGGCDDCAMPIQGYYAENGGDKVAPRVWNDWGDDCKEPDDPRQDTCNARPAS
jgi:hypothetical protein